MPEGRRELLETPEFTAQFDEIVQRYSRDVIVPVLTGLFDGIAKNPQSFGKTTWHTRLARSDSRPNNPDVQNCFWDTRRRGGQRACTIALDTGKQHVRRSCREKPDVKPQAAPRVPGNTEAERMSNALKMVLTVPKA